MTLPDSNLSDYNLKRLIRTKITFEQGIRLLQERMEILNGISLVLLDSSIEQAGWIALERTGQLRKRKGKKSDRIYFDEIIEELTNILPGDSIAVGSLKRLHDARNSSQHAGIVPSESDMVEYALLSEKTLTLIYTEIFELDFTSISKGALIKDKTVRELYILAEKLYFEGDYMESILRCGTAFQLSKSYELIRQYRTFKNTSSNKIYAVSYGENGEINKIEDLINELQKDVYLLKLGLNSKTYQVFEDIFGSLLDQWDYLTEFSYHKKLAKGISYIDPEEAYNSFSKSTAAEFVKREEKATKKNALTCILFTIDQILRWEEVMNKDIVDRVLKNIGDNLNLLYSFTKQD